MTMVPAPNLRQPHFNSAGSFVEPGERSTDAASYIWKDVIRSDPFGRMADDESRASSFGEADLSKRMQKEVKEEDEVDMDWLQLSLGNHVTSVCSSDPMDVPDRRDGLTELDLLSGHAAGPMANLLQMTSIRSARPATHVASASSMQDGMNTNFRQQLEAAWRSYWHGPWNSMASSSSSSVPFHSLQTPQQAYTSADFLSIDDMRVVDPPLRPPSGLWFVLQAAQNQEKESFLPQLPKSYLRVKDGRVTVVLLMKYLSSKLGLHNESQVEITCREQELEPWMTLQHVRDKIWCSSDDATTLNTHSPASEHLMILQYSKKALK